MVEADEEDNVLNGTGGLGGVLSRSAETNNGLAGCSCDGDVFFRVVVFDTDGGGLLVLKGVMFRAADDDGSAGDCACALVGVFL
jgi:hypothetical protein